MRNYSWLGLVFFVCVFSSHRCELCGNSSLQPQQLSCHAGFSVWPCHFSAQHWHRRGRREVVCVCVCEKHTWQERRPPTLHRPTSEPSHPPASLSPPFHPSFFPSLYPRPRGKRCICVWTQWCHSWQLEVLKLRRMNWKSCLTLFTTDTGTCMWDLKSFL